MPVPNRKIIKEQLITLISDRGSITPEIAYSFFSSLWALSLSEQREEKNGRPIYQNKIRWAHQDLVQEGLIEKSITAGRGNWRLQITETLPPEEYEEKFSDGLTEGSTKTVTINAYERNKKARKKCLEIHGYTCAVCSFDFEKTYGEIGKECIHVHHLIEISSIKKEYVVNPKDDLAPVCPNCHYIIHRRKPAFTISEVKAMLLVESS